MKKDYKMKKYFLISLLIFSAISFTGCGTKNISYEKYSIERDLNNNIGKIDKSVKLIDSSEQKVIRKLGNKSYSFRTYELEASDMNKEISKEFFNQYFTMNQKQFQVFSSLFFCKFLVFFSTSFRAIMI